MARPPLQSDADRYDVIIAGGALSGGATALMLLRRNPGLRVAVVERSERFSRRVGESTVEISSYFLGRVLGLTRYLNHEHLCKQGLRFHFYNANSTGFADCSEIGPGYNVRLASYQVDRARLDEHILGQAAAAGAHILRPARVTGFSLEAGGRQRVTVATGEGERSLEARWLVDATGIARMVGKKMGWISPNTEHPISSVWCRWKGVGDLDCPELHRRFPAYASRCKGTRSTATNHLIGRGWWSWWIPLRDGDTSIGIVFDERLVELHEEGNMGERLRSMLSAHPMARELLQNAEMVEGDVHFRRQLPYRSAKIFTDGCILVGDAAAFMDPFYSPGMDWIAFSSCSAVELILHERAGGPAAAMVEELDGRFRLSYQRWFEAIYRDKYYYMGDYQLMRLAFLLDVGTYYFGVVSQPYKYGLRAFTIPPFSGPHTAIPFRLIRFYNRRLARIGEERMRRGRWGQHNSGRAYRFESYTLNWKLPLRILGAALGYLGLELREGWRSWFSPSPAAQIPRESALRPASKRF